MCTVTIHRSESGFTATMNRDEAFVRAPERKPEFRSSQGGIDWCAPFDGEKGGTWMGVNSFGVAACLLNAYQPGESLLPDTTGRHRTRGEIVPAVLEAGDAEVAHRWVESALDPARYPSFTLLLVTPVESTSFEWLGRGPMRATPLASPWTIRSSSGWDSADVIRWREERFVQWIESGAPHVDTLPNFHLLQEPGHEERSPLMRREWSGTRSITQARVQLAQGRAELLYWPEPTPETRVPAAHGSLRLAGALVSAELI
jgi:hypothetical protein